MTNWLICCLNISLHGETCRLCNFLSESVLGAWHTCNRRGGAISCLDSNHISMVGRNSDRKPLNNEDIQTLPVLPDT